MFIFGASGTDLPDKAAPYGLRFTVLPRHCRLKASRVTLYARVDFKSVQSQSQKSLIVSVIPPASL